MREIYSVFMCMHMCVCGGREGERELKRKNIVIIIRGRITKKTAKAEFDEELCVCVCTKKIHK